MLTDDEWNQAIKQRLGTGNFKLLSTSTNQNSEDRNGSLGDHLLVKISVLLDGEQKPKDLEFFLKTVPNVNDFYADFVNSTGAFVKEVLVYSVVFKQYQKYRLMSSEEESPWVPECYFTKPDLLVMENLIGFQMCDRNSYIDYNHCSLVLSTLAKFHAASIAFEHKESQRTGKVCKLNELYPNAFFENLLVRNSTNSLQYWYPSSIKAVMALMSVSEKYGKNTKNFSEIKERITDKWELMYEYVKPSEKYTNVFCHGDLWPNNIMFRYGDCEGKPEEVRFVDFQLARYVPPAHDITMFLYLTTDREFRGQHLEALLSVYHESLKSTLLRHGLECALSWDELRDSCHLYQQVGSIMATCYHHETLIPPHLVKHTMETKDAFDQFMKWDREDIALRCYQEFPHYKERLTEDLETLVETLQLRSTIS